MQNLGSATLEDIEVLILGGAWMELQLELRSALRLELQDIANNYRTQNLFTRNTASAFYGNTIVDIHIQNVQRSNNASLKS